MANNFAAFFETLMNAADEYNQAKVGRTMLLDSVYKDVKPEAARRQNHRRLLSRHRPDAKYRQRPV